MVSQMAHAKNLGEPLMAHLENLCNIPCLTVLYKKKSNFGAYPEIINGG